MNSVTTGDTYIFSGYQYDWVSLYEPGIGFPPANTCSNSLGATTNSAYVGLIYAPAAVISFVSPNVFEGPGTGGIVVGSLVFSESMPSIAYASIYAPVPPASRLTN